MCHLIFSLLVSYTFQKLTWTDLVTYRGCDFTTYFRLNVTGTLTVISFFIFGMRPKDSTATVRRRRERERENSRAQAACQPPTERWWWRRRRSCRHRWWLRPISAERCKLTSPSGLQWIVLPQCIHLSASKK